MKPRKVVVTLEILTDEALSALKDRDRWDCFLPESMDVTQVQVNVVKTENQLRTALKKKEPE